MSLRCQRSTDGVVTLVLSHAPVNAVATPLRAALMNALLDAEEDDSVCAVVIAGNENLFSAGADLVEFGEGRGFDYPSFHAAVLPFIHDMRKPVVAAITGLAIGGGLELALWCHARVTHADAPIGLPETTLGLMPGAGGTQLLPRAIGVERATNLIIAGTVQPASAFEDAALIDEFAPKEDVVAAAGRLALRLAKEGRPFPHLSRKKVVHPELQAFLNSAREQARSRRGFVPGMALATEAIALSAKLQALEGLRVEFEMFRGLVASPEARAIRHAFFAERAASKIDDLAPGTAGRSIERAAVIGAGYMGSGIAHCLARAGIEVYLFDVHEGAAEKAVSSLNAIPELASMSLHAVSSMDDLGDVDLTIEAAVENLSVKQEIFRSLDQVVRAGCILATNTSTLDVNAIAAVTRRPEDVIGLHFFGPAPAMRLLEVVRADQTSHPVLASALQLAKRLRKTAVVARVGPGFIANRIYNRFMEQALALAAEGVRPWQVDFALEAWGWRMGPFRTMDLIGNDVLVKARAPDRELIKGDLLLEHLVAAGRLGRKSGKGWYAYDSAHPHGLPAPDIESMLPAAQRIAADTAIADRCMLAMIHEAVRVLEDGIAQRASDIDLSFLLGYGFPKTKGGPLFHAEEMGLSVVVQKLLALQRETFDPCWTPPALLTSAARNGGKFGRV